MEIQWYKVKNLPLKKFRDVPNLSGVYFVRWLKNEKPVSIPRLRGVDHKGILYIGSAKNLKRRVRELWNGINFKVEAHTIGKTIIFCKIFEIIDLDEYEIAWEELGTHEEAVRQEWAAIRTYATKYREPLPLNLSVRRKLYAIGGIVKTWTNRIASKTDEFVRLVINS
jgi:predicted GIY-YIG superfamily endonuclease